MHTPSVGSYWELAYQSLAAAKLGASASFGAGWGSRASSACFYAPRLSRVAVILQPSLPYQIFNLRLRLMGMATAASAVLLCTAAMTLACWLLPTSVLGDLDGGSVTTLRLLLPTGKRRQD